MYSVYGTKQRMCIDRILQNPGLYVLFQVNNNFRYIITFPNHTDLMIAQSGETVAGHTLENLVLEYETIDNPDLADRVSTPYSSGRSLSSEHVTSVKALEWSKDSTFINENVNLPRKPMKAIVMLFTNKNRKDSEQYVYPNIESVKITIQGVPNSVLPQGNPKSRFCEEAKRLFDFKDEKRMKKPIYDNPTFLQR